MSGVDASTLCAALYRSATSCPCSMRRQVSNVLTRHSMSEAADKRTDACPHPDYRPPGTWRANIRQGACPGGDLLLPHDIICPLA